MQKMKAVVKTEEPATGESITDDIDVEEPSAMEPEPVLEEPTTSGAKSSNPTENEDLGKQTKKVLVEKNKCLGLSNKGNKKDLIEQSQEHNISNATTAEMMAGDITPAAVGGKEMIK